MHINSIFKLIALRMLQHRSPGSYGMRLIYTERATDIRLLLCLFLLVEGRSERLPAQCTCPGRREAGEGSLCRAELSGSRVALSLQHTRHGEDQRGLPLHHEDSGTAALGPEILGRPSPLLTSVIHLQGADNSAPGTGLPRSSS